MKILWKTEGERSISHIKSRFREIYVYYALIYRTFNFKRIYKFNNFTNFKSISIKLIFQIKIRRKVEKKMTTYRILFLSIAKYRIHFC